MHATTIFTAVAAALSASVMAAPGNAAGNLEAARAKTVTAAPCAFTSAKGAPMTGYLLRREQCKTAKARSFQCHGQKLVVSHPLVVIFITSNILRRGEGRALVPSFSIQGHRLSWMSSFSVNLCSQSAFIIRNTNTILFVIVLRLRRWVYTNSNAFKYYPVAKETATVPRIYTFPSGPLKDP